MWKLKISALNSIKFAYLGIGGAEKRCYQPVHNGAMSYLIFPALVCLLVFEHLDTNNVTRNIDDDDSIFEHTNRFKSIKGHFRLLFKTFTIFVSSKNDALEILLMTNIMNTNVLLLTRRITSQSITIHAWSTYLPLSNTKAHVLKCRWPKYSAAGDPPSQFTTLGSGAGAEGLSLPLPAAVNI